MNQRQKYREERTIVRGLRRMPVETTVEFKQKVVLLRGRFEKFNLDVSELCQWLMSIRPKKDREGNLVREEAREFWEFFLNPDMIVVDPTFSDSLRLKVFDELSSDKMNTALLSGDISQPLLDSMDAVRRIEKSESTRKLFIRLAKMPAVQRMILLKAAADWVYARYDRLIHHWEKRRPIWQKEKTEWEAKHPELTEEIHDRFTQAFHAIEIKKKSPRVCLAAKLVNTKDDCDFAGERIPADKKFVAHSQLCKKYWEFRRDWESTNPADYGKFKKKFPEMAWRYIEIGVIKSRLTGNERMEELKREEGVKIPLDKWWFPKVWNSYLKILNLNVKTLRDYGKLPHCLKFDQPCEFNKHTQQCLDYYGQLKDIPTDFYAFDDDYRKWRKQYLAGPKKPSFTYPSAKSSPAPKIFGEHFYEIDWDQSVVKLRLDDMKKGEFLSFRFKEWPGGYDVKEARANVSSVHLSFIGARARVGFRFAVAPKQSQFSISQEEIEKARSGEFAPREDERIFPAIVRDKILESFQGDPNKELRILTVDIGETGAAVGFFRGREFLVAKPLRINKLDKLYESLEKKEKDEYRSGLNKDHVGRHLDSFEDMASEITTRRGISTKTGAANLASHDLRYLALHTRWMIRDWARLNASQIIKLTEESPVDLIVLESERGFVAKGRAEKKEERDEKSRKMGFFAYGLIRRKLTEKAVERGMRVIMVPYRFSSQVCSECGCYQKEQKRLKENKTKRTFICEHKNCKYETNSDANAARVIGRVFWGLELPSPEEDKA